MTIRASRLTLLFAAVILMLSRSLLAEDVRLMQILSRENPNFPGTGGVMTLGRDGNVYLTGNAYVLRVSLDGSQKLGGTVVYAMTGLAANKDGILATANAHFSKSVNLYDPHFTPVGKLDGFRGGDDTGWDGPGAVEAGASGDFYALDQHANRVVRLNALGKIVKSHPLRADGEADRPKPSMLRVCESAELFYYLIPGKIIAVGFDGKLKWEKPSGVSGNPWDGWSGGFDAADDGTLYVLESTAEAVQIFDRAGQPAGTIALQMTDRKPTPGTRNAAVRVTDTTVIVRQQSPTEMFQVYDRATGARKSIASTDHERLTVTLPSLVWTAGEPTKIGIEFVTGTYKADPTWRAWIRPFNEAGWTQLPIVDNAVTAPADFGGLYQFKVTTGVNATEAEYVVRDYVEIRAKNAVGSALLQTPGARLFYAAGETIPISVYLRGQNLPKTVDLSMLDANGKSLVSKSLAITDGKSEAFSLLPEFTSTLSTGKYTLTTTLAGFTVMKQSVSIGPGERGRSAIRFMRYGDYGMILPVAPPLHVLADTISDFVARSEKIGIDFFSDRLGNTLNWRSVEWGGNASREQLAERLKADPIAIAPEAVNIDPPVRQILGAMTAMGWRYMPVPTYMDDGLPIGLDWAGRGTPGPAADKLIADRVTFVTQAIKDFPAFTGWSWAANWWVIHLGKAATTSDELRAKYAAAHKQATETGAWDPVLDEVSDIWQGRTVEAQAMLRTALNTIDPSKKSAVSGPYRAVQVYPPVTFSNVDEVDLHYQAEQIQPPGAYWHAVDYQKRPGKPAWGHPELWNDDGTGAQIGTVLMAMLMRGADGIGTSGDIPNWPRQPEDARSGYLALPSLFRAVSQSVRPYATWIASMQKRDPIAILASRRMFRFDDGWTGQMGARHFDRIFEAYQSCLAAHMPASIVFVEDFTNETFANTKAILLVDERVELEPEARKVLDAAKLAGVRIFYDGTCRKEAMGDFSPLGVSFDKVDKDESAWQDDSSYYRFATYLSNNAQALRENLKDVVKPIAQIDAPGILVSEKVVGTTRVLWVVNNRVPDADPGMLWRNSAFITARVPQVARVKWDAGSDIYDATSLKRVTVDADGSFAADLRHVPARIFVALENPLPADGDSVTAEQLGITAPGASPGRAMESWFGPRLRDVAVNTSTNVAIFSSMNVDRNIFTVDLQTGQAKSSRVGDSYAYAPSVKGKGQWVTGFDQSSPEGYALYRIGPNEVQRFAQYGLPNRPTNWAFPGMLVDRAPAFAIADDESWVASAGNLGLVVWSPDGKILWQQDWWKDRRHNALTAAMGSQTLVVADAMSVIAYDALTGTEQWQVTLAPTGAIQQLDVSADGRTLVVRSDTEGGRVFVVRNGKIINTFATPVDVLTVSPDGTRAAVIAGAQLKVYDSMRGLLWHFTADDSLHSPRFSVDGSRIVVASELGSIYVLDQAGSVLLTRDVESIAAPAWLADGSLVVGTWNGDVVRLDANFAEVWRVKLSSDETDYPPKQIQSDPAPAHRVSSWGNAEPTARPLDDNLLKTTNALISVNEGDFKTTLKIDPAILVDGKTDAPDQPWLTWGTINYIDSGWRGSLAIILDTFRTQVRVEAITLVEDPAHPESWLRDCVLQYWDARNEKWIAADNLLADQATHTHVLKKPIEAGRFRLVSSALGGTWPAGNIRLGEIVLHGQVLGASAPDIVEKKPVAVLFDEKIADLLPAFVNGFNPGLTLPSVPDAFSGATVLQLDPLDKPGIGAGPLYNDKFEHTIPGWDFEIAEHPQPGQYRYLRFAWRALSPKTTGVSFRLAEAHARGITWSAGKPTEFELAEAVTLHDAAPQAWQVETVDLWEAFKHNPPRIRAMTVGTQGGPTAFDRILLGKSLEDLDAK